MSYAKVSRSNYEGCMTNDKRIKLPQVTLCAVTSVNVAATLRALEACLEQVAFADCLLLSDRLLLPSNSEIRVIQIASLKSASAYSEFLMHELVDYVATSHCLIAQWDGHILDAQRWQPEFLEYDYIGASWPQFDDGHDVGNGGFSLRSRRLMELCRDPDFVPHHPEDVAIGRTNRKWLEEQGMRFASKELADLFAAERVGDPRTTFGYHGVWNMPGAIGTEAFWKIYCELDDRGTLRRDFFGLLGVMGAGKRGIRRMARMTLDRLR
jgi:hypothetical protein